MEMLTFIKELDFNLILNIHLDFESITLDLVIFYTFIDEYICITNLKLDYSYAFILQDLQDHAKDTNVVTLIKHY